MRKSITINIPEPCKEDWNSMTARDKGRHCAACQKTVIDFTKQTDEQIVNTFETGNNICGRFKIQQLNREVVLSRKDKNSYLSWVASGLFAFLGLSTQDIFSQEKPKTVKIDSVNTPSVKGKPAASISNEKVIKGAVTAASDGLPLPGATIIVKGTTRGTQADFDGNFSIRVKVGETLVISFITFESKEIRVSSKDTLDISMVALEEELMGEVVVGGAFYYTNSDERHEPYITNEERKYNFENRMSQKAKWIEKNKQRREQWRSERLAKREVIKNGEQERTAIGKFLYGIKRLFSKK
ncbi:MAG: carboxypeptidase-like regulatory domain-containing protein [Bacteroidota bacterium]